MPTAVCFVEGRLELQLERMSSLQSCETDRKASQVKPFLALLLSLPWKCRGCSQPGLRAGFRVGPASVPRYQRKPRPSKVQVTACGSSGLASNGGASSLRSNIAKDAEVEGHSGC